MSTNPNSQTPLISVVMPVYNQEQYGSAAIESILNQTFQDFEFIIVNDGSTDGTNEILKTVSDPRVRILSLPRSGFLKALEHGVRQARGKWVARMDSDDISAPDRLERELEFLEAHPECSFVGSVYGIVTPNGKYLRPRSTFDWKYIERRDITLAIGLFADPSLMFNREVGLQVGLYDVEFENEKPLLYKMLARSSGAVLGHPLHFVRWRLGSHSRSEFEKRYAANRDIRLKYHPGEATLEQIYHFKNEEVAAIRAAVRCVNYYLLAGDNQAALVTAFGVWKHWPVRLTTTNLVIKALLRWRGLRGAQSASMQFVPMDHHGLFFHAPSPDDSELQSASPISSTAATLSR